MGEMRKKSGGREVGTPIGPKKELPDALPSAALPWTIFLDSKDNTKEMVRPTRSTTRTDEQTSSHSSA